MPGPSTSARRLPVLLSDATVVRRVVAGETELFEVLMRRYNQRLFRVAQSILNDPAEAEDVLQETYVRAYSHLSSFEGRSRFSTWLTKIAVYEALGRRKKRRRFSDSEAAVVQLERTPDTHPSPERSAGNDELRRTLEWAIQQLAPGYRVVFVLRELEELDTRETAETLGLSVGQVKVRLHRARKTLQSKIDFRLGHNARRLYSFHLDRCDRVVAAVFERLAPVSSG